MRLAQCHSLSLVIVDVVRCLAQSLGARFTPHYGLIMPGVKSILQEAMSTTSISHSFSTFAGKAMECAGLVGEAVGMEVFATDALDIIRVLFVVMERGSALGNDSITFDYVLPACVRIAKTLGGTAFEPFIPMVVTPLLVGANQDVQFRMEDVDDEEEDMDQTNAEVRPVPLSLPSHWMSACRVCSTTSRPTQTARSFNWAMESRNA